MKIDVDQCVGSEFDSSQCSFTVVHSSATTNPFSRLSSSFLYVGGVQDFADILSHPGQVIINLQFLAWFRKFFCSLRMIKSNILQLK